ncbi:MAG: hypothetical protein ACLFP1_06080 [Candidatus Goldiibacteriota bacterium]
MGVNVKKRVFGVLLAAAAFVCFGAGSEYRLKTQRADVILKQKVFEKDGYYIAEGETEFSYDYMEFYFETGTFLWRMKDKKRNSELECVRKGEKIKAAGILKGKETEKTIEIDSRPWFQNPAMHGRQIKEAGEKIKYWVINPDDLSAVLMNAEYKGIKTVEIRGERMEAHAIEARPDGFFSFMASLEYFYSILDFSFQRMNMNIPFGMGGFFERLESGAE